MRAINCPGLKVTSIEKYINTDSVHGNRTHKVTVVDDSHIIIAGRTIAVLNSRSAKDLAWRANGVSILFECSGAYDTMPKLQEHDVDYIVVSAPPKDIGATPMFVYGVNDRAYAGESIISVASCTTNCIAPFLAAADAIAGGVKDASFITVHAATASQSIVDRADDKARTTRSIFNNIIPHTTGASKTIDVLMPHLKGKVKGTSIRVPVSNVSMVDLNLRFNEPISVPAFLGAIRDAKYKDVIALNKDNAVSMDFCGTPEPCVLDATAITQLTDDSIKFCLWYDNEWSFCAQMIHMARTMAEVNTPRRVRSIRDVSFKNQSVGVPRAP